ncbi:tape measure protein [Acidovorax sp. DW039]|uniref:tape measure protein n=1 Tax=Acidovorax sp. DW039 TaxID=3095606 RepID=UPI00308CE62A|nr:tape measure protein [Acidovorax sp. DW039]
MANDNQIDFTVRLKREGIDQLAGDLKNIEGNTQELAQAATAAGSGVDRLDSASKDAGKAVSGLGDSAEQAKGDVNQLTEAEKNAASSLKSTAQAATTAGAELGDLAKAVDEKTRAIKAGLQAEQSEIELQRQHLAATQAEQQARLKAAQAQGDEAAASRALTALRQSEADQLALIARAKRAEATAVDAATAAKREELSALGPLTAATAKELQASENYAKSLRVQAAAADQAAQRTRDMGSAQKNAANTTDQLSNRVSNLSQLLGQMAGALGAAFTFRELVTAAAQMEQLQSGLTAVTGDAAKAAKELEFVRTVAVRIGADVTEVGKAFLSLAASTKGTAVEGEPTRQVFEAVATAMGKAGKSSAETTNALQALSQMASKGVVQAEELRGQLGEALPGALNAAAKGMGITTAELMKLVEEGKIAASDLFPALTKGLKEIYGSAPEAQTLSQEFTNVKNTFTEMADNIGKSGGLSAVKTAAELAQGAIVLLDMSLVGMGKTIGTIAAAVANWDFSGVKTAFDEIEKEAQDKLLRAASHNEVLRSAIKASGDQALITALATQDLAAKTEQAGTAAANGSNNFIKLQNGYRLVLESIREQIAEQEKSLVAREAEGKAAVALASAFGTETEQRAAVAAAAAKVAAEQQKLAALKLAELQTMKEELKSLQAEVAQMAVVDDARKKQITDLEKQIGLRQQDADKAVAQARSGRLAAEQAKAEAEAYKDNSARLGELRDAYERTKAKLEEVRAARAAGKATAEDVTKAELEAGKAALVYRDALQDQMRAIEAKRNLQLTDLDVQAATIRLAMEQQQRIYEVAKARGDERGAIAAQNEIRRLEIELLNLTAQAKRIEAEAAIASAQAKKAELIAAGEYNGAKKLEIEAALKAAEVKRLEGDIAETTANKLRDLSNVQGQLKGSTDNTTNSIQQQTTALNRLANTAGGPFAPGRRSSKGEELGAGVEEVGSSGNQFRNREGMTSDAKGNVQQQFVWTQSSIVDYLKSAGLEEAVAVSLSKQFLNSQGGVDYEASAAQKQWAGKFGTLAEALGKMAEYYKYNDSGKSEAAAILQYENSKNTKPKASTSGSTSTSSGSTSAATGGNTYVSNITLNGTKTTVKFADAESQSATERLLRDLTTGKGVVQ